MRPASGTILLLLSLAACASRASAAPAFLRTWGTVGEGDGQFIGPRNIALASDGRVLVLDNRLNRAQVFTPQGTFLAKFGSYGSGQGEFLAPLGIAVGSGDMVYVGDQNRIQQFTISGAFVRQWGSQGSGDGQFNWMTDIVTDASGNVFATDIGNSRIQKFSSDGVYLTQWPLIIPGGGLWSGCLTIDSGGILYALLANVGGGAPGYVYAFDGTGTPIGDWSGFDWTVNGIGTSHAGGFYAARAAAPCVQSFSSSGGLVEEWGPYGSADGEFSGGNDLVESVDGELFVLDAAGRVEVFNTGGVPARIATWGRLKADYRGAPR